MSVCRIKTILVCMDTTKAECFDLCHALNTAVKGGRAPAPACPMIHMFSVLGMQCGK